MVVRANCGGTEVMAGRANRSVGGVGVDTARRTGRGGNRGEVGGVLPAVSLQKATEERFYMRREVLINNSLNQLHLCLVIKGCIRKTKWFK